MKTATRPEDAPSFASPREVYDLLDRHVVGQERAKRAVSVAAWNHYKRIAARRARGRTLLRKSNVLLIGPTGCGKTHIARSLADALQVPFTVVDATEYTEAGYYGKDVEVMVAELLFKANHSIEDTQRGVVFIDEIDKIARRNQSARTGAGSRDIGGEGVQQALLKLLEGREIFVPLNVTQHWNKHDFVQVDTTDILFVCAGTFSDLFAYGEGSTTRKLGFEEGGPDGKRRHVTQRDLLEYGMLAEFLGRLPVTVELDALSEDDLVRVLTVPSDSIINEYRELLALDGVTLDVEPDALAAIAQHAHDRGHGARGLRGILEEVMRDVMFDAPTHRGGQILLSAPEVKQRLASL